MASLFDIPEPSLGRGARIRAKAKVKRSPLGHDALIYVTSDRVVATARPGTEEPGLPLSIPLADVRSVTYRPSLWRVPSPAAVLTIETAAETHLFRLVPTLDPPSVRVPGGFRFTPVAHEFVETVVETAGLSETESTFMAGRLLPSAVDIALVLVGLAAIAAGVVMLPTVLLTVVGILAIAAGIGLAYLGARDLLGGLERREWRRDAA